jgi:hypothetical protein
VGELLEREVPEELAKQPLLRRRLTNVAGGNPFHLRQSILALRAGGAPLGDLPQVVSWRLGQLPDDAVFLLRVLCALGPEVPLDRLALFVDDDVLLLGLELLRQERFVNIGPNRTVSPVHPALENIVLATMSAAERIRLHRQVFEALRSSEASTFAIAHHAYEAELENPALTQLERAGDEACRRGDTETAALVHYRKALHTARWRLLLSESDGSYVELSLKLADALRIAGHKLSAKAVYQEILGIAAAEPPLARRARLGLELLDR